MRGEVESIHVSGASEGGESALFDDSPWDSEAEGDHFYEPGCHGHCVTVDELNVQVQRSLMQAQTRRDALREYPFFVSATLDAATGLAGVLQCME